MAAKKKDDFLDMSGFDIPSGDYGAGYGDNPFDTSGGAYDPNLDPSLPSGDGAYDPRLDTGVPMAGNQYGGGGYTGGGYGSGAGGGSSGGMLQQIIHALTGSNGGGSAMGALGALAPFLASLYGGIQSHNATQDATHQIQQSLSNANDQVSSLLGGAQATYKPYMDAGLGALAKLQAMQPSNLAGNFKPIGSGKGLNLSQIVKGS